jgi:hypothetical protein
LAQSVAKPNKRDIDKTFANVRLRCANRTYSSGTRVHTAYIRQPEYG